MMASVRMPTCSRIAVTCNQVLNPATKFPTLCIHQSAKPGSSKPAMFGRFYND